MQLLLPPFRPKAPMDRLDYPFDFSSVLLPGELITAAAVTSTPGGLTLDQLDVVTPAPVAWIEAGTSSTRYLATCAVVTSQGRRLTAQAALLVGPNGLDAGGLGMNVRSAFPAVPATLPGVLLLDDGDWLQFDDGNQFLLDAPILPLLGTLPNAQRFDNGDYLLFDDGSSFLLDKETC